MKRTISISLFVLLLAACSSEGGEGTTTTSDPGTTTSTETLEPTTTTRAVTTTTEEPEQTTTTEPVESVGVAETSLGPVLVDAAGFTMYVFTADIGATSSCYEACATTWPAVPGGLGAGEGVTATLDETIRDDGTTQLTVSGRPVYTYAGDGGPAEVEGQGVGGAWFALSPAGDTITG